nr:RecName: Full=Unknown protein 2 [Pinus halepensis]
DVSLPAEGFR